MTNRDWLRNMSDEQFAKFLLEQAGYCDCEYCIYTDACNHNNCLKGIKKWLQREHKEDK